MPLRLLVQTEDFVKYKKAKEITETLSRDSNLRKLNEGVEAWNEWVDILTSQSVDWRADLSPPATHRLK